jgi:F-type H+-transporting ATPase subunit alpha
MAAFAQFASDLDASTQRLLARGARLTEVLKQGQFSPYAMEEQVVAIYAGVRGYLDRVPVDQVTRFEKALLEEVKAKAPEVLADIRDSKDLTEGTETKLKALLEGFAKTFA